MASGRAAPVDPAFDAALRRMLAGRSATQGAALEAAIAAAAAHPLGDRRNPVRAAGPAGQRAYLAEQRCSSGSAPTFIRAGSAGIGVFGNIVDIYKVACPGSTPAATEVWMDMYHSGYREPRPLPGFTTAET